MIRFLFRKRSVGATLLTAFLLMLLLQLLRVFMKSLAFLFIERTDFSDRMVSMGVMLLLSVLLLVLLLRSPLPLSLRPRKLYWLHSAEAVLYLVIVVATPFLTGRKSPAALLLLFYSAFAVPLYEELLFRGLLWNLLDRVLPSQWLTFAITAVLFGLWHFGYADSLAMRVNDGLGMVLLFKALTGLCFGIVLGLCRRVTGNWFSTLLLHGMLNVIAS